MKAQLGHLAHCLVEHFPEWRLGMRSGCGQTHYLILREEDNEVVCEGTRAKLRDFLVLRMGEKAAAKK
jgi:hypothetical protein